MADNINDKTAENVSNRSQYANHFASEGLQSAVKVCRVFQGICFILLTTGIALYIAAYADVDDKFRDLAELSLAGSIFSFGFTGVIGFFIINKVLEALTVITRFYEDKAAEK